MAWNLESLADLKAHVFPFGSQWRHKTGRSLTTARDGLDFLAAMKDRDEFWAALSNDGAVDLVALRRALPAEPLPKEVTPEDHLRSVGLSERDIDIVVESLDASVLIDDAIRSAFDERSPQKIARALERVLDSDRSVVAAEHYAGRLSESRGMGRSLALLMGAVVLLVGTTLAACGPQSVPETTTDETTEETTEETAEETTTDTDETSASVSVPLMA